MGIGYIIYVFPVELQMKLYIIVLYPTLDHIRIYIIYVYDLSIKQLFIS